MEHATLPKEEHKTRDIWTAEVLQKALEACDDDIPVSYTHLDVYKRQVFSFNFSDDKLNR